jgi:hypothetical protein
MTNHPPIQPIQPIRAVRRLKERMKSPGDKAIVHFFRIVVAIIR